jgi:3-oxoacyl-[acyl-carrier protein] reductase
MSNESPTAAAQARKVAFVTAGAGAGIGSAIVRGLAEDGWDVVVTDAHERRVAEHAARLSDEFGREFLGIHLDVTDYDAVGAAAQRAVEWRGGIDGLVNSAGWNKLEPIHEMARETWLRTIDVDLNGTFNCLRQILPLMITRGGGVVVNISSIAAWETSTDHGAAYSAAKSGVNALTRVAAAEMGAHGVRVNAIAPGLIFNEFLTKSYPIEFFDGYAERRSRVGRVGRPEDVAALAVFLMSDKAGYITGETYGISGGVLPHA